VKQYAVIVALVLFLGAVAPATAQSFTAVLRAGGESVEVDTVVFVAPSTDTFTMRDFRAEPGTEDTFSFGSVQQPTDLWVMWALGSGARPAFQIRGLQLDVWYDLPLYDAGPFAPPKILFTLLAAGVEDAPQSAAGRIAVAPSPFSSATRIRFPGSSRVEVCDRSGRTVRTLAGNGSVTWDGRDGSGRRVEAGVYFVRRLGSNAAGVPVVLSR
jgi:hypothetical protein